MSRFVKLLHGDGLESYVIRGDCTRPTLIASIRERVGRVPLIYSDPPYGNILPVDWDRTDDSAADFVRWMLRWTALHTKVLVKGGAFYVWGGIGVPGFRPFPLYAHRVEAETSLTIANWITWSKKRGYGVRWNYLFTREELLFMVKGNPKKPRRFIVPLLNQERGYAGFNSKYPAKSKFKRRTNIWSDVSDMMRGKVHDAQKPEALAAIPIQVHTAEGEVVLDAFAGSGSTALAAMKLGRRFVAVEKSKVEFGKLLSRLIESGCEAVT